MYLIVYLIVFHSISHDVFFFHKNIVCFIFQDISLLIFTILYEMLHTNVRHKSTCVSFPTIVSLVKIMAFALATVSLCSLVIWFSSKSLTWKVLFGLLLDQFVSSFDRAHGFQYSNLMQFDSLTFQQKILIDGFNGLGTIVLALISENPRSRFMLELELLLCLFRVLKRVARSLLFWRSGLLDTGYNRMFGVIGLAVPSCLGCRSHPARMLASSVLSWSSTLPI